MRRKSYLGIAAVLGAASLALLATDALATDPCQALAANELRPTCKVFNADWAPYNGRDRVLTADPTPPGTWVVPSQFYGNVGEGKPFVAIGMNYTRASGHNCLVYFEWTDANSPPGTSYVWPPGGGASFPQNNYNGSSTFIKVLTTLQGQAMPDQTYTMYVKCSTCPCTCSSASDSVRKKT